MSGMDDIYAGLLGGGPTSADQMQARIAALRQQKILGTIGSATGDAVLSPIGQSLSKGADTDAREIGQQGLEQSRLAQTQSYQGSQIANQTAEREQAKNALAETMRHNQAEERLKLAEYGLGGDGETPDKNFATMVDRIGKYEAPPLNASATKNPRNFNIMAAVMDKFPDYDGTVYNNKNKTVQAFGGSGKQGQLVRSADVGIQHLGTLQEAADDLNNGRVPFINRGTNWVKTQLGLSTAPTNFEATKKIVADEITKFITGSASNGGAVFDREAMENEVNAAMNPAALKGVMNKWVKLMGGQIQGLKHEYETNTRLNDFDSKLAPETQKALGMGKTAKDVGPSGWHIEPVT